MRDKLKTFVYEVGYELHRRGIVEGNAAMFRVGLALLLVSGDAMPDAIEESDDAYIARAVESARREGKVYDA